MTLDLAEFLHTPGLLIDVRSPAEYVQGHIPGSLNMPLFDNQERALVGTLYKQKGPEPAFQLGLELVGPKLAHFVHFVKKHRQEGIVRVHCWRGGMRSSSMARLLEIASIPAVTLRQGYKNYRKHVLQVLQQPRPLLVLGGLTGSGKTQILHSLKELGEQTIDLEQLACHRGSSYGALSLSQPSNEQFENTLAEQWMSLDAQRPIWIEDESRLIGRCKIPDFPFQLLRSRPLFILEKSLDERIQHLKEEYGQRPKEELIQATQRLQNRLGGARTKTIVELIQRDCLNEAIAETLIYYDSTYLHSLSRRQQPKYPLYLENMSPQQGAMQLMQISKNLCVC
jgi:tRNA 2-selenouridine synthase